MNRENYYGFQNGNYLRTYDDIGTAKVEHDFHRHFTLRDQVRYANYVRDVLITEPQIATPITLSTPLSQMIINRHEIGVNSVETYLDEQLDLTVKFDTGFLHHTVVTGIEGGKETSDPTRPTWTNVPTTSLLNPNPTQALSGIANDHVDRPHHVSHRRRVCARYDAAWKAVGPDRGIRWDRFNTAYTQQVAPAAAFNRVDEMPSWRAALVFKPFACRQHLLSPRGHLSIRPPNRSR